MSSEKPMQLQAINPFGAAEVVSDSIIRRAFPVLAPVLIAFAFVGCSTQIDVERINTGDATATLSHTPDTTRTSSAPLPPTPPAQPPLPSPSQPTTSRVSEDRPVSIRINNVTINYRAGDTHVHTVTYHAGDTHVHEMPTVEKHIMICREPPRTEDNRCEQLRLEHERRVAEWKSFPFGR